MAEIFFLRIPCFSVRVGDIGGKYRATNIGLRSLVFTKNNKQKNDAVFISLVYYSTHHLIDTNM